MRALVFVSLMATLVSSTAYAADAQQMRYAACTVQDFGNGVYYFVGCYQRWFGQALSAFRASGNYEIISIAPDDSAGYGATVGYFVVVKQK